MPFLRTAVLGVLAATVLPLVGAPARAAIIDVTVTVANLAPANSVAITPLRFGFNRGVFDAFNNGQAATAPIISVAEGGTGSAWFPAFAAADPTAVLGSAGGGAVLPGGSSAPATYRIDTSVNQFFTFGAMIVPSNDFFIGNDDPMAFRLFDDAGTLLISSISQSASDIWNAGSEAFDPANAAFLVGGDNDLRTPENGVVGFNFAELAGFNGRATAAGYVFDSQLRAGLPLATISFSATAVPTPVPEPASVVSFAAALAAFGMLACRRRRA